MPSKVVEQLRKHAVCEFPNECCGILIGVSLGDSRSVTLAIPCTNAHPSPAAHYSISPEQLIAAQRDAREQGCAIVGFYHSHPNHPAEPSAEDCADALWQGCSYLILSAASDAVSKMNSFCCATQEKLIPEKLEII